MTIWRACLAAAVCLFALAGAAAAEDWREVEQRAAGQEVYFNAWGGDGRINAYIAWTAAEVEERWGIRLVHVKLADTAEAVARVLAEKTAGATGGGSVDLIWINGENFAAMKQHGLLFGPFVERLPNAAYIDFAGNASARIDFTVPTEGYEAPWGTARFNIIYDSAEVSDPPARLADLPAWVAAHPGRFTYPAPPDFIGTSFLKQLMLELADDRSVFAEPPPDVGDQVLNEIEALDGFLALELEQHLWRGGVTYPPSGPALRQLLADGEVDFALSFNPSDAASAVAQGLLPPTTRAYLPAEGSLANTHFLAIPYNADAKEAALVVVNFLLSPEAQARKLDPAVWGDPTVLALERLPAEEQALFAALPPPLTALDGSLPPAWSEPHPGWTTAVEQAWQSLRAR